ncbi:papain-like cysteine protease family protein [Sinosporangium siamense]|uniref:Papain-like cysteine protease AvrRpt2 n=1 Tax=Sinosporangium siamense TaxID=1367973 RepID=A0A919V9P0_9ACTN|nr:papain-like cysteine protease family protein [Sinosporangium siamense]GII95521.1 hypothetical protein Ssi02_57520 [Sinosporangium siamense]
MFRLAVALAIATTTWIGTTTPAHAQRYDWYKLNFVQQEQQKSNWCWAAIGNSVAAYHGYGQYSQNQFCNMAFGNQDINLACPNNQATLAEDQRAFRRIGMRQPGYYSANYLAFSAVVREIDAHRPILTRVQWKAGGGHMEVIFGYDRRSNSVHWSNPWGPDPRYNLSTYDFYVNNSRWSWTHSLDNVSA